MKAQVKNRLACLIVFLVATQWLVACSLGGASRSVTAPSGNVVISFATSEWDRLEYEQLAEIFHQAHPHITVKVVSYNAVDAGGKDAMRKLADSVDTFACPTDLQPEHSRQGLLRDLTPFLEADTCFDPNDFYPGLLDGFQWDGGVWGLPSQANMNLILYDKASFEEAGIAPPHIGWTYDDFTRAAQQLTIRDNDQTVRYGFVNPLHHYMAVLLILGRAGVWVNKAVDPPLPTLDDPAIAEAVQWYVDMVKQGVLADPTELGEQELNALINGGKAAMWAGHTRQLQRYSFLNPGIASLPEGQAIVGWKWDNGYAMSRDTAHPQGSYQWLSFLTRQSLTRSVWPARRSVAEVSAHREQLEETVAETYRYILEKPEAAVPWEMPLSVPLQGALEAVLAGEHEVNQALAQAQARALAEAPAQSGQIDTPMPVIAVPSPEPEGDRVVITFYHDGSLGAYYSLAERFQEEHPGIMIDLIEPIEWGISHWAEVCDCFVVHASQLDHQHLLSLDPFLEADPGFSLDDFYPQSVEAFRQQGALLGLPIDFDLLVVYYNQDLFDEAGVEYPQPGWDLDDFLEKAKALTKGEGEDKVYGYTPFLLDHAFFLEQKGATIVEVKEQYPWPSLDSSATIEAMRWYADLASVHGVMPILQYKEYRQDFSKAVMRRLDLVSAGRVAMWTITTSADFGSALEHFRVGVVPLSLGREKMSIGHHNFTAYVISANSTQPQACWEWIKFLSDHSGPLVRGRPARRSIAESPVYSSRVGEEAVEAFSFTLEHLEPSLDVMRGYPSLNMLYYWIWEAYDRMLEGVNEERALTEAQAKAEAYITCLGENIVSTDLAQHWACAHEVDPEIEIPPDLGQE